MKKWLGWSLFALFGLVFAFPSWAKNYALCTGLNEYSDPGNDLEGCVPDAQNVYTNIILRGEWKSADATLLTNSQGTFAAVSNKLMSFASSAVSGDVVLYYQSSHGYQSSGKNTGICMYDKDMSDSNFAKILANFKSGVKVVIVLDTCHSGGMFKSARRDGTAELSSPFAFAQRVNEELAAIRADEAARGIRTAAKLAVLDCAWITAADYDQYSWDGDEGGKFTVCFVGSVKSGACDKSPYGNGDFYATFQEMFDYAVAQDITHGNGKPGTEDYTMPQCTNTTVLSAVTFGWVGKEAPGGVRFAPIPDQTATVGAPLAYTLVASNSDGSTGTITYSVASSTAPAGSYSLSGANFTFTPPSDGTFSFEFLGTNATAKTSGKASMSVSASLAAPAGLENSGITASSFTANWDATAGAASYLLDVSSSDFGAKAAGDDVLLNEDFSGFTGTSADRSTTLDTYLNGTGWTGSKVFENSGSAKLGSGSYNGWIATPELDLSSGGTVSFLLTQYGSDANTVTVSIISGDQEDEIGTATPGTAETVEFAIPAASEATSVKIETSAKRAIIDDLVVSGGSAADVLANQSVSGTSFTVEGLNTDTYYWHVRAVGNAKGPFSKTMEVTLQSDPSAPPTIRAIDDIAIDVGETATFEVKVSAPEEAPVTSLEITDGDDSATLVDSVFSFTPAAPGTYDFTVTAVNANDSTSESFAVVASLAEPETPEASSVGSDGFTATWAAIPGAASYELDVIQGATSGGGSGGGSSGDVVLSENFASVVSNTAAISDFTSVTANPGWSGENAYPADGMLKFGTSKKAGTFQSPAVAVSGSVTVTWTGKSWNNDNAKVNVGVSVDGGSTFSETPVQLTASLDTYTTTFPVSGSSAIVRWQSSAASNQRFFISELSISSGAKARDLEGTHVEGYPKNVGDVTSYEVTGLQPLTEYTFAVRAVAAGETTEWSAPQTVKTSEGPSAPAWSAIPAQHTYAGFTFQLDLSAYLSGSPTPTVTADVGTVTGLNYVYEPDQTGTVTVTLTAVNDSGTLATTFTIAVDEPPVGGNHYAVIVGCNKYDTDYIPSSNFLNGCVPDANHVQALVTSRGLWEAANVTKLTDSAAKHASILSAIAAAASNAIPGDTFLYFHSSHGGNYTYSFVTNTALYSDWPIMVYSVDPEGVDNCICSYDADFTAAELASALAAFDPAVNIVVMIDACHSAGMFLYDDGTPVSQRAVRRNAAGKAMRPADPGLFAEAVGAQIGAIRRARGIRAAANVAFVTAANFDEYSFDSQSGDGGEFTTAFIEGVTNGLCDGADYGDQDGWATFYEGWNYAKDIATGIPEGTEVDYDGHAVDANGYALYDNTDYAQEYDEPEYYYDYYFTHPQIDNESLLRVVRVGYAGNPTLDAPVAAEASGVTSSSFTASWSAVDGATGYHLQVATDSSFSTGAASDTIVVGDLAATGTSYTDFSDLTKDSGAVYAGTSAKSSSGAIQLNNTKSAGIWTTASGGTVSRVAVVWNDATSNGRTIKVYGSDSPLTSYSAVTAATSLGSIVYGTSSELAIEGSYAYVGFITSGGALYLDSITFDWGTAGSESSIVFDQDVGNVTSHEVTGLDADTDYWYRVQALGDPVDSDFSNVISLTTAGGTPAAPVWSDIPAQTVVAGEDLVVDLKPYVTGTPRPTISADAGSVENGVLTVSFAEAGSVTVNLTAENTEGSAPATLAVTVTAAPVTVPTLALSNPTSEGFDAAWDACDGVTSYTLEVSKAEFRGTRDGSTILSEDFASCDGSDTTGSDITSKLDDFTSMDGWSGSKVFEGVGKLKLGTGSANGWVATPALDIPAGAVLTCKIAKYGSDTGQVAINLIADGATNVLKGAFSPVSGGETVTVNFTQACTGAKVQFISSAKRFYLDDVVITGEGGGGGDDVLSFTVEGLFKTVTGLDPETLYYARVKGASDWSGVESIRTLADVPAAPAWLDLPDQTATAGLEFGIDLSTYVTGSPFPTITVDGVEAVDGAWTFTPDEAGTFTFELVATNSEGTDEATLTVVVSDTPSTVPELTLSNPTAHTFDAEWTACTGATSYQFQVATASDFKAARAGDAILSEDFAKCAASDTGGSDISSKLDQYTQVTGWTGVKAFEAAGRIKLGSGSATGSLVTPAVDIPAGATLSFMIAKYGTDTGTVDVQLSADGGDFESLLESPIAPVADGQTYTIDFAEAVASAKIKFVTSAKRAYVDDVVISGEGGGGSGSSIILDTTTNGLSLTVVGLDPETTYYARVRMAEGEWSAVESITTLGEGPAGPAKYAVCVGLSEYDMAAFEEMGLQVTPLKGCVNDASYLKASLTERGGWDEGNVSLLTNGSATKSAIRGAIAAAAAKAKAGDTFVYEHSSHGGQGDDDDDYTAALVVYENLYKDYELAEDLAAFADGVKVVVLIDACHSAGMIDDGGDAGTSSKARPAAAFDIARRVSALIDANRAARKARGEDVSRTLTSDQIGWVTAAAYEETSKDGGYYDTDAWMDDGEAEGEERGGAFLAALEWGWWTGKADVSGEGDGDGWFDAYEGWSFSTPVCAEFDQTPQYHNADVLRAVELGWVGGTAPSDAILFDPVPGAEVAIGEEATLAVVAKNADGTTDGITLSIVATDPEDLEYTFADGALAFTPAEDGIFLFTVQAVNGRLSATKILGVTAVLPAPVAQEVEAADIAENGFTARWLGVDAARNYQIQVSTAPDFPMGEPEELIEEGFDDVTNSVSSLPEGWEFTGTFGTYPTTGGEAAPSIKLSTDGATLTTPSFKLNGGENGLAFWTKGNPGSGNVLTSTLTVQQLVGDEWKELAAPFVPSKDGETKEIEGLDPDATCIRFVMTKTSGNIAIDDVVVAQAKGGPVIDDDEIPAGSTSYAVEGLEPGTTYYFRVRAIANTKSAWSEVIEVTTAGEKPIPVPDLTVIAPETSPDTSLAAFWVCTGATEFRFQVATDEAFASLVVDEQVTEIAMTVTGLTPDTTYYVRVCALDGDRAGDWSEVATATTAAGPGPQPQGVAITGITLDTAAGTMILDFEGEATAVCGTASLTAQDWQPIEAAVIDAENSQATVPMTTAYPFLRLE